MQKTSKIKSVEFKSEWANPKGGVIYYHDIEFENGDKGQIGKKEKNSLSVGDELTYTVESTPKGNKIKTVSNFTGGGNYSGKSKGGFKSDNTGMMVGNAITNATNLVCHGKVDIKDLESVAKRICEISMKLKKEIDSQS